MICIIIIMTVVLRDLVLRQVECYVGEPCEIDVTAAMYETDAGFPFQQLGFCRYHSML